MWEPRFLTTVYAFTACYRDSFTFYMFQVVYFWFLKHNVAITWKRTVTIILNVKLQEKNLTCINYLYANSYRGCGGRTPSPYYKRWVVNFTIGTPITGCHFIYISVDSKAGLDTVAKISFPTWNTQFNPPWRCNSNSHLTLTHHLSIEVSPLYTDVLSARQGMRVSSYRTMFWNAIW
jgi:hypothetical protein